MDYTSPAFERIYKDYLRQVANLDIGSLKDKLGVEVKGDDIMIPFFGKPHRISSTGIMGPDGKRPSHSVSVVLCKYLLLCPESEPEENDWISYKDFKDAAPFVEGFRNNAEIPIARNFSGKIEKLKRASEELGGVAPEVELSYQLPIRFDALPKVPILMLFNDEDEEFPAQCSLLFQRRAQGYLDMECLAIIGWTLSDYLLQAAEDSEGTLI